MSEVVNILNRLQRIERNKSLGNWVDRIKQSMTGKGKQHQALVHPCIINSQHTLVYERGLENKDPDAFRQIVEFARTQGYQLKEDQRANFLEGVKRVKNRRRANVVSLMVLTASLMSQSVYAKSDHAHHHEIVQLDPDMTHHHIQDDLDMMLENLQTEEELAAGLLNWINQHSSFDYNVDEVPDIKKVSAQKMAEVAFGGELPKAVNPKNLQIFGLYNFNEKAVYLLDSIDLKTDEGKGILLHELVHYLQYQTGINKDVQCKNELESLAYVLEAKFLESHNHQHSITESHINKLSQCRA